MNYTYLRFVDRSQTHKGRSRLVKRLTPQVQKRFLISCGVKNALYGETALTRTKYEADFSLKANPPRSWVWFGFDFQHVFEEGPLFPPMCCIFRN